MAKQTAPTPRNNTTSKETGARRVAPARGGATEARGSRRGAPNIATFFDESRAELRKVTWPTREDATNLTVAVIAMTVAIAAFLGLVDGILDLLAKPILGS